jgi:uncharacterized OB-fold protein
MTSAYDKPLPIPSNETLTKPFWEATKRKELLIPRCNTCSKLFFYPRELCIKCGSKDLGWQKSSGLGKIYSYTRVRQAVHPSFQSENGHAYTIVQLSEGVKLPANIVGISPDDVKIDMDVIATFEDVTPEVTLVQFKPL